MPESTNKQLVEAEVDRMNANFHVSESITIDRLVADVQTLGGIVIDLAGKLDVLRGEGRDNG